MKRMSKAEETLQKEIRALQAKEDSLLRTAEVFTIRAAQVSEVRRDLESNQHKLQQARERASERNKPKEA